ncbi:hypothetical protein ABW20_dc0108006 [Dactylellina cionopaga]|nr:hypothetical protein ABW20_dc0108006 [Dactylellina cionopaga]
MATIKSKKPWGYHWRSSKIFILSCVAIALFSETFLYDFVVPILPYILGDRNNVDPSDIQKITYQILTVYGVVLVFSGPFIGQWADQAKSRRMPLIISLAVSAIGTVILAAATHLSGVFIGRILQAVGGTGAWIVATATIRDSVQGKDIGKAFGFALACANIGSLAGPVISGILLEFVGYWMTWASVLVVLLLDIVMRFIMIEKKKEQPEFIKDTNVRSVPVREPQEDSVLIFDTPAQSYASTEREHTKKMPGLSVMTFYKIIFSQRRVIIGLGTSIVYSSMLASYSTTLPTHVKFSFAWGSGSTGLLFAAMQAPTIVMGPVCGWLRDKVGTRKPAGTGYALLAILLFFLGAADQKQFPWASTQDSIIATYVVAAIGIGLVTNLTSSVAILEITCAIDDLESQQPGIFGNGGAYSRCYSLTNTSFSLGLTIGSFLSGYLTDNIGYFFMNCIFASTCAITSVIAFTMLQDREPESEDSTDSTEA